MSEYLNIYLVPKKSKDGDKQASPMYITSYSRCSDVFEAIYENVNVAYDSDGKTYSELSPGELRRVCNEMENNIAKQEQRIKTRMESLANVHDSEVASEILGDIDSFKDYANDMKATLAELKHILWLVETINSEFDYGPFDKVVANRG